VGSGVQLTAAKQTLSRFGVRCRSIADALQPPPEGDWSKLYAHEERLDAFMRHAPMLAFVKDSHGRYVFANPAMERTFGFSLADVRNRTDVEWLSSPLRVREHDREALDAGRPIERVETVPTADGSIRHFVVIRFPLVETDGRRLIGGVAIDVTVLRQAELRVGESERRYRHLVESGQGLIWTHDLEGKLTSINPAALRLLGYAAEDVIGRNFHDLLTERGRELFPRYLERVGETGMDSGLMFVAARDGQERTWRYHNVKVTDSDQPPYVLGHAQDVTELREAQEHLQILSLTDELTGLHNRRGFFTMASHLLRAAPRTGQEFTVLYTDVDDLKTVNDTYGHDAGSALLVGAADVLKNTFRAADVVGRIGGDEFVALAAISRLGSTVIVERLQAHLANLNAQSNRPYTLSLSYGMAHFDPTGSTSLEEVVRQADQAMYEQKRSKRR
jgi:diguanylate cyclase (GGDEF)-like protein/PAS domain S-box-containing protein